MGGKQVFHEVRSAGLLFTQEEWWDYLDACRKGDENRLVTQKGKYDFNDCDVCINPDVMSLVVKGGGCGYSVTLKWCECGNGLWSYGIDYQTGTGGGGFSPSYCDGTKEDSRGNFHSERECKIAACENAISILEHPYREDDAKVRRLLDMVTDYKRGLTRPVQLELF